MNLDDSMLDRLIDAVDTPDLSGTTYELRGEIGRGGMGVVYRAFDRKLDREVALKITDSEDAVEARMTASLEHPGIVPVYDAGQLPDGRVYYAMRLVRGLPLDRFVTEETPLSIRLSIFQKVCEAIAFAHSQGVVHRDIKPANIMVGSFGEVAVLDWGVAAGVTPDSPRVVGTPRFMAPEQAAAHQATPLADVYSLGAVLGILLPADAARPLRAIAVKATQAEPSHRYDSPSSLSADLSRHLDGFAVEAYRESFSERAGRFVRRNRTLLFLVGAYFAARIAIFFFSGR